MILDIRENLDRYRSLCEGFDQAIAFLLHPGLSERPPGRHDILGDSAYAVVAVEKGRRMEEAQLETHDRYLDIQMVLAGEDTMGWKPRASCRHPSGPYDPEKDLCFYTDAPDAFIPVKAGAFAVFFPEDAHMPLISEGTIHKVVVKIRVNHQDDMPSGQ